jgi:hypothetical protein
VLFFVCSEQQFVVQRANRDAGRLECLARQAAEFGGAQGVFCFVSRRMVLNPTFCLEKVREGASDRGRLLERVAELERMLAAKEEKTSEQLAVMRRDLDKQAEGKTERLVREIVERNVYLSSHREEFDKNNNPAAALRLVEELKVSCLVLFFFFCWF